MDAIIFILHFFFFGLTVLFFLLKFHTKHKRKIFMFSIAALWILFGGIDFIMELRGILVQYII